jgi:alkaline phosphatase D
MSGFTGADLSLANPWVKYHEGFSNGFAVVEFGRERTQYDYWFIADRTNFLTTASVGASWEVRNGMGKLFRSANPLASGTLGSS